MIISKDYQTNLVLTGFFVVEIFLACGFCSFWLQWNALSIIYGYWKRLKGMLVNCTIC